MKDKSIAYKMFRTQYDDSIMCRFYFTGFTEYMIARETLLDYANNFS